MVSSIFSKNERNFFDSTTMIPKVNLFLFVFGGRNWGHQKDILKLTDLYISKTKFLSHSHFTLFTGLKKELSTHFRRNKYLHQHFNFLVPERISIGFKDGVESFYYYVSVEQSLRRLLQDKSLRDYIINEPFFINQKVPIYVYLKLLCTNF